MTPQTRSIVTLSAPVGPARHAPALVAIIAPLLAAWSRSPARPQRYTNLAELRRGSWPNARRHEPVRTRVQPGAQGDDPSDSGRDRLSDPAVAVALAAQHAAP